MNKSYRFMLFMVCILHIIDSQPIGTVFVWHGVWFHWICNHLCMFSCHGNSNYWSTTLGSVHIFNVCLPPNCFNQTHVDCASWYSFFVTKDILYLASCSFVFGIAWFTQWTLLGVLTTSLLCLFQCSQTCILATFTIYIQILDTFNFFIYIFQSTTNLYAILGLSI